MPSVLVGKSKRYYIADLQKKYVPERFVAKSAYGKTGCIWR